MKPSKKRSRRRKQKPSGPTSSGSLQSIEEKGSTDDESRAFNWLIEAFGSSSLDQITSAYHEADRDAYRAAGILGAHLVDPEGDGIVEKKKGSGPRKQKRVAAATGMVSGVIGKGYARAGRRGSGAGEEVKDRRYSPEEGEQFLCSMLGDNSELGMGVVRDVLGLFSTSCADEIKEDIMAHLEDLWRPPEMQVSGRCIGNEWTSVATCRTTIMGQYGYNVGKALDALLEISASSYIHFREKDSVGYTKASIDHSGICPEISNNSTSFQLTDKKSVLIHRPSKREHEVLEYEGCCNRENATDIVDSVEQPPSRPGIVKADFQQQVLQTLFNIHDLPKYEPKFMNWKKVVQKVESFGQGLEFQLTSLAESPQDAGNGKERVYEEFRSVAGKHWDEMRIYYQKAAVAYSRGERAHAAILSEKGKYYSKLAREADEKASREIFEARNKDINNTITIDLHGQHVKQAIGLLKLHLLLFTYIPSINFLKVITGCGADGVGKGRLKRSVIDLVEREDIAWSKENSGTLILQLDGQKEYSFIECDSDSG